ncbi:MAG: Uma2 family endonuclease, partial [Fimbriimonadales bacterium]|nr:Uma2 family endonuclease [Fimbriimonadales bacterium]
SLIDELVRQHLGEPKNYFCGGNMFLFFSYEQAQEIIDYVDEDAELVRRPRFNGSDFFLVKDVDGSKPRDSWTVWHENGRYPDLIIEFVSNSTRKKDVEKNVQFYERVFRTPEYFWFDRRDGSLKGYRLQELRYRELASNERGWLWSEVLGAYLGVWEGDYRGRRYQWLRLYNRDGTLVPTREERIAELEAELKRLRVGE